DRVAAGLGEPQGIAAASDNVGRFASRGDLAGSELCDNAGCGDAADPVPARLGEVEQAKRAASDALRAAADRQHKAGYGAGGGNAADLRRAGLGEPKRSVRADRDVLRVVASP